MLLEKLIDWRPPEGRASLNVADAASGWTVTLTADRRDVVGCLVWEVAIRRSAPGAALGLGAWAAAIAERTTGLAEPLTVLEVDEQRNEALLRSDEPAARGERVLYFEALLKGTTEAVMRRYQASHQAGEKREQVPFALTYEGIGGLVRGLTGSK
jgi:hypothetical protein